MPRPSLPPTPSSSTDITGKDGVSQISSLQLAFELPPPAIANQDPSTDRQRQTKGPSAIQYPMQAAEAVKSRRRASTIKDAQKDAFALPPPPTRTRKIIQMKPRGQEVSRAEKAAASKEAAAKAAAAATATTSNTAEATTATSDPAGAAGSKKKQASASSTAGRKQARKTAHSLIERRRRSKMNEEFAVLKGMIPACTGEMHKLAILQASIEYVRYLEDCVAKLKAQHEANAERSMGSAPETPIAAFNLPQPPQQQQHHDESGAYLNTNVDIDMVGSDNSPSPTTLNPPASAPSHHSSVSPALRPNDVRHRHDSYSSVSTDYQRYGYTSATTSPAFGPQQYTGYAALPGSALTSPALQPQRDLDQEATAALLMLNSDRRGMDPRPSVDHGQGGAGAGASGRGMSVRDLLSS